MLSDTLFLQPINLTPLPNPNFANATGVTLFSNYSQPALGTLTAAQTETLVNGGVATAIADAKDIFNNNQAFSALLTNTTAIGLDGSYTSKSQSETKVIASFEVDAKQSLSFNFSASLALAAKEIENSKAEYNEATAQTSFLVLDTSNINKPKLLGYFGMWGKLIPTQDIHDLKFSDGGYADIDCKNEKFDTNNNNGTDFVFGFATGTYQQTFKRQTNVAIVEINTSTAKVLGDSLIGNLGKDVTYGTIGNDKLIGTNCADKIYGSLGDDIIEGNKGDDILEGGQGNDTLDGGEGNDQLYGGEGNDILIGGRGNDVLVGGAGSDTFVFKQGDSFLQGEYDVIKDFEPGVDKILFQNWGKINASSWFSQRVSQNQLTNTQDGALLSLDSGGKLLFQGVNVNQLSASDFNFA